MNPAMGTVVGELIQMNSKMVMTPTALFMALFGVIGGGLLLAVAVIWWSGNIKRWWVGLIGAALLAGLAFWGNNLPRVKEIHACVNGPISLEQVSAVYDIVKIDGKELTLRVR